jgi:hypothetical protein
VAPVSFAAGLVQVEDEGLLVSPAFPNDESPLATIASGDKRLFAFQVFSRKDVGGKAAVTS